MKCHQPGSCSTETTVESSSSWSLFAQTPSLGFRVRPFTLIFDTVFALFFSYLQVWPLAASYFVGMSYHLWMQRRETRQRSSERASSLQWVWVVVFFQALLAVRMLGPDAGFQYYLLVTIPPGFANLSRPFALKLFQAIVIILFFLASDIWSSKLPPLFPQTEFLLSALRHINIIGMCMMLAGFSYADSLLVKEARDILYRIASTDELTGLLNRRSFSAIIEREAARSQRDKRPTAAMKSIFRIQALERPAAMNLPSN